MRGAGVPSVTARVRRDPLALIGIVLVGALAMGASTVGESTAVRVASDIDSHWRGAYDILVRPAGVRLDLERTAGVVEPDFLDFAGLGGITPAQVEAIRAIEGVEVAAPAAFLGFVHAEAPTPVASLSLPTDRLATYLVSFSLETDDGLGPRRVQQEDDRLLTSIGDAGGGAISDAAVQTEDDGTVRLPARAGIPPLQEPILAVDPVAERLLLGPSAAFLAPLEEISGADRTAAGFDGSHIPREFRLARFLLDGAASAIDEGTHTAEEAARLGSRAVIPIVVAEPTPVDLTLAVSVTQLGHDLDHVPAGDDSDSVLDAAIRSAGRGATPLGTATIDLREMLRPLQIASIRIDWPAPRPSGNGGATFEFTSQTTFDAVLTDRPDYTSSAGRPGGAGLGFTIMPAGTSERPGQGTSGSARTFPEPLYRTYSSYAPAVLADYRPVDNTDRPFYWAPLGTFDLSTLDLPDDPLSYVPFGAWDPPDTMYVADPDGTPAGPVSMRPRLDPAGLITLTPLAITDIPSAVLLRGDAPIDAVRVRVAGLTDFSADARARVEVVASAIAALGLDVDVVAGSSRQSVDIYVPDYFLDGITPRDLGWVTQRWTTLGAATRVEGGLTSGVLTLLGLAIVAAAACAGGLALMGIAGRQRDMVTLRAVGWSRGQTIRWVGGEALVGALVVLALAGVGWWLGGRSMTAAVAGCTIAGVYLACAGIAGLVAGARAERHGLSGLRDDRIWTRVPSGGWFAVRSAAGLGVRTLLARPTRSTVLMVALAVTALAAALGVAVVLSTLARVGPTLLASALTASADPGQWLLLLLIAAVGLGGTLVLWWLDDQDRAPEARVLRAAGWDDGDLRAAGTVLTAGLAGGAAVLAALGVWILAPAVAAEAAPLSIVGLALLACPVLALAVQLIVHAGVSMRGRRIR